MQSNKRVKMSGLDDALNIGIPSLLIFISVGFLWVKLIKPYVLPFLANVWEWAKGKQQTQQETTAKEITFD